MRGTARTLLAAVVVLGLSQVAAAKPIVGTSANTLPQGTFMVDVWTTWQDLNKSYNDVDEQWVDLPDGTKLRAASFVPRVYYGVTDRFTMRVALPVEYRVRDGFLGQTDEESALGFGDVCLEPKLKLYQSDTGRTKFSLIGGVRLPTGDTESAPSLSDGSTDYIVGAVVTQEVGQFELHGLVGYWFNGEAEGGADVKDLWAISATVETAISEDWTVVGEIVSRLSEDPSEFYRVDLCPGIEWTGGPLVVGLAVRASTWAKGGGGVSWVNYDWAPFLRAYYRFF